MTLSRRTTLGLMAATPALLLALPARAMSPITFQTEAGIAINGIDPVAYFTEGGPVPGIASNSVTYNGATWLFSSGVNKMTFENDPEKFGARFGGYCAFAASRGYLAPTIPEAWAIHEDRLYLNATLRALELWQQDIPGNIAKGEANWPGILG